VFNPANWTVVPGSTSGNSATVPVGTTNEVFYQLYYNP
jgi:hypothetical protein